LTVRESHIYHDLIVERMEAFYGSRFSVAVTLAL
jgi:hypothetical protein